MGRKPGDVLNTTNRAAFEQAFQCLDRRISARKHRVASQSGVRLGEAGIARSAAPALNTALTKVASLPALSVSASCARHIGLVFLAGQADNKFEADMRLAPRVSWPRLSVSADGGALLSWWTRPDLDGHLAVLQTGALPVELRAHEGGHSGLAPVNAPTVYSLWWSSSHHRRSPFLSIKRTKSFFLRPEWIWKAIGQGRRCSSPWRRQSALPIRRTRSFRSLRGESVSQWMFFSVLIAPRYQISQARKIIGFGGKLQCIREAPGLIGMAQAEYAQNSTVGTRRFRKFDYAAIARFSIL
jgi:hypothetical protein